MIPFDPCIPAPLHRKRSELPPALARVNLAELCGWAGIPCRVSSGSTRPVTCVAGRDHYRVGEGLFVGVGLAWEPNRTTALRVLEVLAHSFHDYGARECVCGRGLFSVPKRRGRPPEGPRAKTARERMAAMRARERASRGGGLAPRPLESCPRRATAKTHSRQTRCRTDSPVLTSSARSIPLRAPRLRRS